jgi:hypothetical protein
MHEKLGCQVIGCDRRVVLAGIVNSKMSKVCIVRDDEIFGLEQF